VADTERKKEICSVCGGEVKTMAFRMTGVCGENCRKDRDNDHAPARALVSAPVPMHTVTKIQTGRGVPRVQS
jgi:hypothetical protein